jgi:hypothetical protein
MPNGKCGDHPYTDIVAHGTDIYGDGLDELVREIDKLGPDSLRNAVSDLLWNNNPWFGAKPDLRELRKKLDDFRSIAGN